VRSSINKYYTIYINPEHIESQIYFYQMLNLLFGVLTKNVLITPMFLSHSIRWDGSATGKETASVFHCHTNFWSIICHLPQLQINPFSHQFITWTLIADARSYRLPVTSRTTAYTGVQSWTPASTRRYGVTASTTARLATTKRSNTAPSSLSSLYCTSPWELRVS
jgi:hypothetical protein